MVAPGIVNSSILGIGEEAAAAAPRRRIKGFGNPSLELLRKRRISGVFVRFNWCFRCGCTVSSCRPIKLCVCCRRPIVCPCQLVRRKYILCLCNVHGSEAKTSEEKHQF